VNSTDIAVWAKQSGFSSILLEGALHTTIAFSRKEIDWDIIGRLTDTVIVPISPRRSVEQLGDKGAIVLRFESLELSWRWQQVCDLGGSWDYPGYKPHITITYKGVADIKWIIPYTGELIFGPEILNEVVEDWDKTIEERAL